MSEASHTTRYSAEATQAYRERVEAAAAAVNERLSETPDVGVLLGPGCREVANDITASTSIPCADIPHFPTSDGRLVVGTIAGRAVLALDQQLHLYDGATAREVAFPVRLLAVVGVDTVLLSGPAQSVNPQFEAGELMLLIDHINFQGTNPLVGPNVDEWGPRFPDMTDPYDPALRQVASDVARSEGLSLQKGIYLATLGPSRGTMAEHRMARRLGADAAGMSMVTEVIAARHMDLRVLAVGLLTEEPPPVADSYGAGTERSSEGRSRSELRRVLTGVVARIGAGVAAA